MSDRARCGRLRRADGRLAEAQRQARQGVAEIDSAGLRPELPDALEVLGGLAVDAGRPADGLHLLVPAGMLHEDMRQHCHYQAGSRPTADAPPRPPEARPRT